MILEKDGLSFELLHALSFQSNLGISLKSNLHYFEYASLLAEIESYVDALDGSEILGSLHVDYRVKSMQSIKRKYSKHYPDHQTRKVLNDILGFRFLCDNYDEVFQLKEFEHIRIADLSKGKSEDDGYRGVHIYFQASNAYYPIEIQYNTYYDRQLNNWLHKYLYKKDFAENSIGKSMRTFYENGKITNEAQFREVLEHVLSSCKKS